MDDTDKCNIEGHRYDCLLDHEGKPMCDRCGHVDRNTGQDDERPDEWRENDWNGWPEDTPNNHSPSTSPYNAKEHNQ